LGDKGLREEGKREKREKKGRKGEKGGRQGEKRKKKKVGEKKERFPDLSKSGIFPTDECII